MHCDMLKIQNGVANVEKLNLQFSFDTVFEKGKVLEKMESKLFTTFIAVERQFPPSWLDPNMCLLLERSSIYTVHSSGPISVSK